MARRRFAPTPRVTTKTISVRRLLLRIKQITLEEPLRMDLRSYVLALQRDREICGLGQPACRTIGCIAGWGAILLRPLNGAKESMLNILAYRVLHDLMLTDRNSFEGREAVNALFASHYGRFDNGNGRFAGIGTPGSEIHATFVAARIDRFLAAHPEIARRRINVARARRLLAGK